MRDFVKATFVRAIWTFAETALSMIALGQGFLDVSWLHILSVAGVAAVISILKSVIVGLPEVTGVDVDE